MGLGEQARRQWPLALAYAFAGWAALSFTRYDGGVAFLWGASAILAAALIRTSPRHWPVPLVMCATISFLNTGIFGLGWAASLPFTLVNAGESLVAALLLRRRADVAEPMHSLGWFFRYVVAVGLAAPAAAVVIASVPLLALDRWSIETMVIFFAGHSLGNLTLTPLALLLTGQRMRRETWATLRSHPRDSLLALGLVSCFAVLVFSQNSYPLLFLPITVVTLATFRMGRVGAAAGVVLLGLVGGGMTALGYGPIHLIGSGDLGARMQFFQLYLAVTVLTILPVSADLQARGRLLKRVRLSEERFRLMTEHSSDLLMHIGSDGRFLYVSPSMQQIGGHNPQTLIGTPSSKLIASEHLAEVRRAHWATLERVGQTMRYEFKGIMADGSRRWFQAHSRAMVDERGGTDGVLSICRDITDSKLREEKLSAAALTDALTDLPNRRSLETLVEARRLQGASGDCLAILDLDHFKQVNDLYGHDAGDTVLKAFASLVRGELRPSDIAARIGGEEFVVLFPDTNLEQAMKVCERLRRTVGRTPIPSDRGPIRITVSGGVAAIGPDGLDTALKTADRALYRAKVCGRDQFALAA